jgi:nitrogen-specific signal transduction histidine kinase
MRAIPGADRVCASLEDMTERRGMERLLALREKHALMETLVGGIAHELNNKLLPIMGFADLLKARAASGGSAEQIGSYCERIGASAQAAAKIVRALLQMSKPGFDELSVFDLRTVVKDALAMVNYRLEKTGVITTLSLCEQRVPVLGDSAQIHQLLVNLMLNSCDAMEASDARQLGISVGIEQGHATVRVEDTGCGISDDVLGRVFDPFFTTKGPQKGTGLGLTVCFGIVRRHHGVISVERTGPGGTVFLIELPLSKEPMGTARIEDEGGGGSRELGVLRVLVVEDDREGAAFFGDALRSHLACEVDMATSGEEGRAKMEATDFDLVICDVRMPGMSGVDLLEWARASLRPEADRILLVTGDAGDVGIVAGVRGQRPAVLSKPFTVQEFLEACVGVLRHGSSGSVKGA